ncbi:hypothetical protein YC2023_123089 [Brassica napus]
MGHHLIQTFETKRKTLTHSSGARELRNRLGSLRDSVLRQLSRQHKPHRGLNLPRSDGRLLVVPRKLGTLTSELLEDVVDEAVHDPHRFARDSDVGVNLLQDLEDVDLVSLDALLLHLLLLITARAGFLGELLPGLWFLLRRSFLGFGFLLRRLLGGWFLLRGLLLCLGRH